MNIVAPAETYTAMKNSGIEWVGSIPEAWSIIPLRYLSKIHAGSGFPHELQGDETGTIPFLKVSDFRKYERFVSTANNVVSKRTITNRGWNTVPKGSLITAKIGEALRRNHRNITGVDCIIDNNCIAFEPTGIDETFFYYLHKLIDFEWFVNPGAVPSISVQKYRSERVAVPPLNEQRAIASFLDSKCDRIDEAVRIKEEQITLLRERRQILIQQAVTRGLNPDAPMKDSGIDWIGEIPAHWEVRRNFALFREIKTPGYADLPVLSVSIHSGVSKEELSEEENIRSVIKIADRSAYKEVLPGDIAYNMMRAWQGGIGAVHTHGMVSPAYVVARPVSFLKAEYFELLYRTSAFVRQMDSGSKGITDFRKRLYWDDFRDLVTLLPSTDEQKDIIKCSEQITRKIRNAISIKQDQIGKLTEYKTSLINAAVTGKIKVI